jgi:glycosyltransferase involved in cell wall biosynthesis
MAEQEKLRVLAVALTCHPDRGSEPGMGWDWACALAQRVDLTLITADWQDAREAILRESARGVLGHAQIHFVRLPPGRIRHAALVNYVTYDRWHREVFQLASRLHGEKPFDVVHLLNTVGYRLTGHVHKLDAPYVWGPIDGAASLPAWRFPRVLGPRGLAYYFFYNVANWMQFRFDRGVDRALRRADCLVAATTGMAQAVRPRARHVLRIAEVHAPRAEGITALPRIDSRLRVSWLGLMIHRKALPLLLYALARISSEIRERIVVDVVGDGPRRAAWSRLAASLGVSGCLRWHGWVPRARALELLASSDLFVITSLREVTSTVLLEALSLGKPVITVGCCGMGDVVDERCAVVLPVTDEAEMIAALAEGLERLEAKRELLAAMGESARAVAADYASEHQAERMLDAYQTAIMAYRQRAEQLGEAGMGPAATGGNP